MQTMTMRTVFELAYERGEEYDPTQLQTHALIESLELSARAGRPLEAESRYERRRRQERERCSELAYVPDWFDAADVFDRPAGIHGELV